MNEGDFPALYQDADSASKRVQRLFNLAISTTLWGSCLAAFAVMIPASDRAVSLIQAALFLVVLIAALYLAFGRPQKIWYGVRALAESIKTLSWRYSVKAVPFNAPDVQAKQEFQEAVRKLLITNDEAAALQFEVTSAHLVSNRMEEIRTAPLADRITIYAESRIADQLQWYRKKARSNGARSRIWHGGLIGATVLAFISSLLRVGFPEDWSIPVDAVTVLPICALAWLQAKRYQELSSSYTLTAHEIAILSASVQTEFEEGAFGAFVGDAENAFSREHTQWQARRDEV